MHLFTYFSHIKSHGAKFSYYTAITTEIKASHTRTDLNLQTFVLWHAQLRRWEWEDKRETWSQPILMHSQCFLVLHQSEGCELVKLWAASGTFPVVDRREANRGCTELRVRTHIYQLECTQTHSEAPFHRKSCYHFSDTQTQRKHWHWTSYQRPRNRSCSTDGLTNLHPEFDWWKQVGSAFLFLSDFTWSECLPRKCYGFVLHRIG